MTMSGLPSRSMSAIAGGVFVKWACVSVASSSAYPCMACEQCVQVANTRRLRALVEHRVRIERGAGSLEDARVRIVVRQHEIVFPVAVEIADGEVLIVETREVARAGRTPGGARADRAGNPRRSCRRLCRRARCPRRSVHRRRHRAFRRRRRRQRRACASRCPTRRGSRSTERPRRR